MDIRLFSEFNMVTKHRNLSEASKELHITESALSRHISSLEDELGIELFDKTRSPMELTAIGREFLEISCRIGNEENRLRALKARSTQHVVQIRIGSNVTGTTLPILKAAAASMTTDNVTLVYPPTPTQTPFDQIRNGTLDIAIEPYSTMIDVHDLQWRHVAYEDAWVVLESSNTLCSKGSFCVSDLSSLSCTSLMSNKGNATRKHLQDICKSNGILGDVPGYLVLSTAPTYDELFLSGLNGNVIILPECLAKRYTVEYKGFYVARPLVGEDTRYDYCAFYSARATDAIVRFVNALDTAAGNEP